jgi:hypothetical protein
MICSVCEAKCAISKSGLCANCRSIAHRPIARRVAGRTAQRWLAPEYRPLRIQKGLSAEQTIVKAEQLFRTLRTIFSADIILHWNLDNPYMATHARRLMVSYVLRNAYKSCDARTKSAKSERHLITRKAVAA